MNLSHYHHQPPQGTQMLVEGLDRLLTDYQIYQKNIRTLNWQRTLRPYLQLNSSLKQLDAIGHQHMEDIATQIIDLGASVQAAPSSDGLTKGRIWAIDKPVTDFDEALKILLLNSQDLLKMIKEVFELAASLQESRSMERLSRIGNQVTQNLWFLSQLRMAHMN